MLGQALGQEGQVHSDPEISSAEDFGEGQATTWRSQDMLTFLVLDLADADAPLDAPYCAESVIWCSGKPTMTLGRRRCAPMHTRVQYGISRRGKIR